jgi:hypothetical protein
MAHQTILHFRSGCAAFRFPRLPYVDYKSGVGNDNWVADIPTVLYEAENT